MSKLVQLIDPWAKLDLTGSARARAWESQLGEAWLGLPSLAYGDDMGSSGQPNRKSKTFDEFGRILLNSIEFCWIWCILGAFRCISEVRTLWVRVKRFPNALECTRNTLNSIEFNGIQFEFNQIHWILCFIWGLSVLLIGWRVRGSLRGANDSSGGTKN